jgi:hypothetical protein
MPSQDDFQKALDKVFLKYEKDGSSYVDVRAGDLHRQIGDYPGKNHRMPLCCEVMRKNSKVELGDKILPDGPQKGDGASLTIRYILPRTQTISFTVKCAYSKGGIKDPDPLSMALGQDCPACKGTRKIKLLGCQDDYIPCPSCDPNWPGKDRDDIVRWKPCHICHGSALVKRVG